MGNHQAPTERHETRSTTLLLILTLLLVAGGVFWNWDKLTGTEKPVPRGSVPAHVQSLAYNHLYIGHDPDPVSTFEAKCHRYGIDRNALTAENRTDGLYEGTIQDLGGQHGSVGVRIDFSEGTMTVDRSNITDLDMDSAYGTGMKVWSSAFSDHTVQETGGYLKKIAEAVQSFRNGIDPFGADSNKGVNAENWDVAGEDAVITHALDVDVPCYEDLGSFQVDVRILDGKSAGLFQGKVNLVGHGEGNFVPDYLRNPNFRPQPLA